MKTKIICLSHYALADKHTGQLSIINIIDTIKSPGLPLMLPEVCLVLVSEKEKGDPKEIELELFLKLNSKLLGSRKIKIDYIDKNFNNCIFTIGGLVIDQVGKLIFVVKRDNKQIAKHECLVDVIPKVNSKNNV